MAELATIARPYAEALYKAVQADLETAAIWLNELAAIVDDDTLRQFANNPKTTDAQVFDLVTGVIEAAALADLAVTLEKLFTRKLNLAVVLDAELIGGIRVAVGDEVLDTSVKARLDQMKAALTA